jgi:hypothetical protein
MRQQALSFPQVPAGQAAPGRRYIYGEVSLGGLREAFWSSTYVWTAHQYERQWITAAKLCLGRRQPVLFYTDVTAKASMAYHVVPSAGELLVFEQILGDRADQSAFPRRRGRS